VSLSNGYSSLITKFGALHLELFTVPSSLTSFASSSNLAF
jgi:hypothetical protein